MTTSVNRPTRLPRIVRPDIEAEKDRFYLGLVEGNANTGEGPCIRVGYRVPLPTHGDARPENRELSKSKLVAIANEPIKDGFIQPERKPATLTVYGMSRNASDDSTYTFAMALRIVDGAAYGRIIKSQDGINTKFQGRIMSRDLQGGLATDFDGFSTGHSNLFCIIDPNTGTLTDIDLGLLLKLTVDAGTIPLEGHGHNVEISDKDVRILQGGEEVKLGLEEIARIAEGLKFDAPSTPSTIPEHQPPSGHCIVY